MSGSPPVRYTFSQPSFARFSSTPNASAVVNSSGAGVAALASQWVQRKLQASVISQKQLTGIRGKYVATFIAMVGTSLDSATSEYQLGKVTPL